MSKFFKTNLRCMNAIYKLTWYGIWHMSYKDMLDSYKKNDNEILFPSYHQFYLSYIVRNENIAFLINKLLLPIPIFWITWILLSSVKIHNVHSFHVKFLLFTSYVWCVFDHENSHEPCIHGFFCFDKNSLFTASQTNIDPQYWFIECYTLTTIMYCKIE